MGRETLAAAQRRIVLETLAENNGHQGRTAEQLQIPRRTLTRWLRAWKFCELSQDGQANNPSNRV
jgi:DNA-binding NtrC family response regulator